MLQKYSEFAPTPFDRKGAFLHDRSAWLVGPCSHTRDSGPFTESNWYAQLETLREIDPDEETWEEHNFNHWGPGWFGIVIAKPDTPAANALAELAKSLEDYPLLNETDSCEREWEAAQEIWANCYTLRDRIKLCADNGVSIFAARHDSIPQDDCGSIFEACRPEDY